MMRRTSVTDLLVGLVVVGVLAYLLLRLEYSSLPPFQWFAAVPILALAVADVVVARRVRGAVRHDPGARPITALAIARAVALAKACAICGAGIVGAALALVLVVAPDAGRTSAASHDLQVGIVLAVSAALLSGAGLVLERSTVDPNAGRRD